MTGASEKPRGLATADALMGIFGFKRVKSSSASPAPAVEDCPRYDDAKERGWIAGAHPDHREDDNAR